MQTIKRTTFAVAGIAAAAMLSLTACGGSSTGASSSSAPASTPSASSMAPSPSMSSSAAAMDPAANLVGPGCAAYAAQVPSGKGSVSGMALDPVAVAASNNPILTTLTAAVSGKLNPKVNLVDTLNGSEFTIFAPTDDAFKKIDAATIDKLKTDDALLSKILTYHVVPGKISPGPDRRHAQDGRGWLRHRQRHQGRAQGRRRQRRLRRRPDRQRHGLHGRLRPDAQVGTPSPPAPDPA